jgi:DNA (cytosine-5)-methyltransferase 1
MLPVIRLVRPRFVVLENVAALTRDWWAFGAILRDLAELGMDARWSVLSACAMGAPHTRARLFVVAHANSIHGAAWMGHPQGQQATMVAHNISAGSWRDAVDRAMATTTASGRGDDGVPAGLDGRRVAALGDAVMPSITQWIGRVFFPGPPGPDTLCPITSPERVGTRDFASIFDRKRVDHGLVD